MKPNTVNIKDNPKFVIFSSIIIPITASLIGLIGVIIPNLVATDNQTSQTTNETVVEDSGEIPEDTYGYISIETFLSTYSDRNKIILTSLKAEDNYEAQRIKGVYYILGYTKNNYSKEELTLLPEKEDDFEKLVAIPFDDIKSVEETEAKISKKDSKQALLFDTNSVVLSGIQLH